MLALQVVSWEFLPEEREEVVKGKGESRERRVSTSISDQQSLRTFPSRQVSRCLVNYKALVLLELRDRREPWKSIERAAPTVLQMSGLEQRMRRRKKNLRKFGNERKRYEKRV